MRRLATIHGARQRSSCRTNHRTNHKSVLHVGWSNRNSALLRSSACTCSRSRGYRPVYDGEPLEWLAAYRDHNRDACRAAQLRGTAGPCTAGTSVVSISPGFFTGAELNALSDDQLGMYAAG